MTPGAQPGTIGLTQISGEVGKAIEVGMFLNGEGFKRWEHAFVLLPDGQVLEAEPGGARIVPFTYTDVYWCRNLAGLLGVHGYPDGTLLNDLAESFKGVRYSFLDYLALAAKRLRLYPLYPLLKWRITSQKTLICSQLADLFYQKLGAQVFDDGRWNGDVTPMSLYRRDQELLRA